MNCEQVLRHFKGRKVDIAAAITTDREPVTRQTVNGWFARNTIPLDQQIKLEVATGGKLRADLSTEQRRALKSRAAA